MRGTAAFLLVAVALCGCDPPAKDGGVAPEVAKAVAKTRSAHPELFRRKIVLLGFDSCDPDLVEQYVKEGVLPHFAQLMREGAYGPLASLTPTLSPVVWTTIATGMSPQRHGILDFVTDTPAGRVPVTSRMRQADTLWDLLSRQGEQVGVVGWLVTWPADPVNGFLVTDRMGRLAYEYMFGGKQQTTEGRTWPESLASQLEEDVVDAKDLPFAKARQFLDISEGEYRAQYSDQFDPRNVVGNLRLTLATAETYRNIGERLYTERKPRFFASYFEAMDAISHLFMPYAPPKTSHVPTDLYLKYRDAIEANYVWHDRVLGEYMELCDAETTLLVVSDHGFKNGDFRMADSSSFHAQSGAMWHRKYGVFFAWGDGVKRGATVAGASVYDVAPTILAAMGYPVPDDMAECGGKVLVDVFDGGLPFETVPTYRGEVRRDEVAKLRLVEGERKAATPEDEDEMRRLQSLGYIGGNRSDPASTSLNLGSAHMSQGHPKLAYAEFKKVLDQGPRTPMILNAIAEACLALGELDEAEKYLDESVAWKDPTQPPTDPLTQLQGSLVRAKVLVRRRKLEEAEKIVRSVLSVQPDHPQAWNVLAYVLEQRLDEAVSKGDAAAAERLRGSIIQTYESQLRLEPRQADALFELARTRLSLKTTVDLTQVEKARVELEQVVEMNPRHVTAYNNLAIAYLNRALAKRKGDDAERDLRAALANAEKAVSLAAELYGDAYRGYARGYANKAYVLWKLGRLDEAAVAGRKAREIDPRYVLDRAFLAGMASTGHAFPPPPAKDP